MPKQTILNLAGGKLKPIIDYSFIEPVTFLVNLDTSYIINDDISCIERFWKLWIKPQKDPVENEEYYFNMDIYEFLSRTIMKFDRITIYRFLEHVPFDKVLFFIYLLSTVTEEGAELDIIVPDYNKLAKMIIDENVNKKNFESHNILLTTELLNEPSCPHASIWTVNRFNKFFTLEKRFRVIEAKPYKFDDRDIYLRARIVRK